MSNVDRQTSFASGELAPEFYGRIDQPAFRTGLRLAKNFLPTPRGALHSRPGTEFVAEVKDSSAQTRLVSFVFSDAQTYVLELGNLYMRFVKNGSQVLVPNTNPWSNVAAYLVLGVTVTYGGIGYLLISTAGLLVGMTPDTHPTNWLALGVAGTPFQITTPWAQADLARLQFAQSGDVVMVTHQNYSPQRISRLGPYRWNIYDDTLDVAPFCDFLGIQESARVAVGTNRVNGAISNVPAWSVATIYKAGRFVVYTDNHLYRSIQSGNVAHQPDVSPTWWADCSYSAGTSYSASDYVWDPTDSNCYISLKDKNVGHTPSALGIYWQLATDALHPAKEWQAVVTMLWKDYAGTVRETMPCTASTAGQEKWARYTDRPTTWEWPAPGDPTAQAAARGEVLPRFYSVVGFRVYVGRNGVWGLIGSADGSTGLAGGTYRDDGLDPDYTVQPPAATNPFLVADGANTAATSRYPAASTYHEQRWLPAGSSAKPGTFWGSMLGSLGRFDIKSPLVASDPYEFALACVQLEDIRWLLSINGLLIGTGAGVWSARGVNGGVLSPVSVDVRRRSKGGVSYLRPLEVRGNALYVTAKANRVRDVRINWAAYGDASFEQTDLSHFARHLFEGYTVTDWCYAEEPYSLVWAVRSDGTLLSMVYDPASQSLGWAQHDSEEGAATFEAVCSVPEGTEDAVYVVVKRTVNGATKRYIERIASRHVTDVRSYIGSDSAKVFDFRSTDGSTIQLQNFTTLRGGTEADIVSTASSFSPTNVGDVVVFDPDGTDFPPADQTEWDTATYYGVNDVVEWKGLSWFALAPGAGHKPDSSPTWWSRANGPFRATIQSYTSLTTVHVILDDNLGPRCQDTTKWGIAPRAVTGLDHIEGKTVAVLGDGNVQTQQVVGAGQVTLDTPSIDVVVGLPITCDAELLDVPIEQVKTNVKSVSRVNVEVVVSRGFWAGEDFDNLKEKGNWRRVADSYGLPQLKTDSVPMAIESGWNTGGRVAIRQVDPLPLSLVALTREFEIGGRDR